MVSLNWKKELKRKIKYIYCIAVFFVCTLSIEVQATEDNDIFTSASAKVHTAMSDDSDVAANLIVGNMFEVLGAESDANGVIWYQVRTDFGIEGYVKANELDKVLMETQAMQQQPQEPEANEGAEGDADASGEENAGGEDASENVRPSEAPESGVAEESGQNIINGEALGELVVLESVNLRKMPSTDSEILSRIDLNTKLSYFEQYINDAGEVWYRVEYETMTGYVTEGAVMITQQASQPNEAVQIPSGDESEPVQESEMAQEELQSETETSVAVNQAEFEVSERTDVPQKHRRRGFDWMIVILVLGGVLCVVAIIILVKKILKLLRK